jgi:septum site-determining protein MinC
MLKGACELKSAQFALMRLAIYQTDAHSVQAFVADQVAAAPALLEGAPLAIDFTAIPGTLDVEFVEDVIARLRYAGMLPIALVGDADSKIAECALSLNLGLLAAQKRAPKVEGILTDDQHAASVSTAIPADTKAATAKAPPEPKLQVEVNATAETDVAPKTASKIETKKPAVAQHRAFEPSASAPSTMQRYEGQVRSGQQLYAKGRDLLISGPVNNGAEVISDGSVHVYGRLSGKVIAGASGDETARIYCLAFGAELVSIAGVFRVFESIPASLAGRPVQIWREGDKLRLEALI